MPHSHHSHSGQFCSHAKDLLEHVLERAQALGFTHFHLSEHVPRQNPSELYPEELEAAVTPDRLRDTFHSYLSEARRLQDVYVSRGLNVLVGCETENITSPGTLDYLTHILGSDANTAPEKVGKGTVDYIVGSLHHSHAIPSILIAKLSSAPSRALPRQLRTATRGKRISSLSTHTWMIS